MYMIWLAENDHIPVPLRFGVIIFVAALVTFAMFVALDIIG